MKIQTLLLCILSISGVLSQSCTTKTSSVSLVLATEEQKWWGLQDVFFTGENLSYEISDTSYFDVVPPIRTVDAQQTYKQPAKIVQAVPFLQSINGAWLNSFALLDNTNGYNVFWAFGTSLQGNKSPQFNIVTPVRTSTTTQSCFGLDLIGTLVPRAVVDCYDSTSNKNYFQVVYADRSVEIEANTDYLQKGVTGRQIQVKRVASLLEEVVYIYRGAPVSQAPSTVDNSVIEVFTLDSDDNLSPVGTLNKETLSALTGDRSGTFKFNLVEFELDDGFVYVLDQGGKIYRLKFQADGQWLLDSTLDLKSNRPFAMDVNKQLNSVGGYTTNVIVLHWDTFVLYEWVDSSSQNQLRIYDTGFYLDPTNVPNFQISQNFILLQNNQLNTGQDQLTIYETKSNKILALSQVASNLHWLINPYEKRFVSLGGSMAQAWAFSEGQLVLKSSKTEKIDLSVTLTAKSTLNGQTVTCTSTITAGVYDRQNSSVIKIGDQSNPLPLPEFIAENTQLTVPQLVSGPNVVYGQYIQTPTKQSKFLGEQIQDQTSSVNLTSLAVQKLSLRSTGSIYPKAENVIFVDTLGLDDALFFYEVFQTKDFKISVIHCEIVQQYIPTTICELAGTFNSTKALTKEGFQVWQNAEQVIVGALTSTNNISIFECESDCKSVYTIQYDEGVVISSFQFLNRHIWITRTDLVIDVYNSFFPFEQQSSIDQSVAKENGYTGAWNPSKVFGNKFLNPNLIFIDNKVNLIVADYHSQVTFITTIDYLLQNPQVEVAIGIQTFFIAETDGKNSQLREYNYEDLADIKLQKNVYLYWYTFQYPLQADYSVLNGYFYIRALCIKCNITFILIFKPNTSQRDVLFKAISTGVFVPDDKTILFSPSGNKYMFLYVNMGTQQNTYSILNQYVVQVGPGVSTQMVTKDVQFIMRAQNYDWENTYDYTLKVTVFNTRSNIQFNQTAFDGSRGKLRARRGQISQIPLGNDWFTGNFLNYQIECNDCGTAIKIENYVDSAPLPFSLEAVTDFDSLGDRGFLAQTAKNLWFLKDGKQVAPFLDLDLPENIDCKLVNAVPSGIFILSVCQSSQGQYVHITSCVAQNECFSAGYLPLKYAKQVKKFAAIETDQGVSLVVLSISDLSLSSYSEGSIITYNLVSFGDIWTIQKTNEIILTPNNNPSGKFYPADMTFIQYKTGFYKFLITDAEAGLWAVNGKLVDGFLSVYNTGQFVDLTTTINGYGGFISPTTTRYQAIGIYKSELNDSKSIDVHVIVTTNNVAQFAIGLEFDDSDPDNNPANYKQAHVDYEFNRYGAAPALNILKVNGNNFFMVYGSKRNYFVNTLIKYDIPPTEPKNLDVQAIPAEIQYIGGQEISAAPLNKYIPLYFENNSEETQVLYTNQNTNFKLNQEQNSPRLIVNSTSGLQSQDFTIIAYNEQVGKTVQYTSTLESFDISNESGWKWWYTLLIILGVLALIIAIFFIYKKFFGGKKVKESLLGQTTDSQA